MRCPRIVTSNGDARWGGVTVIKMPGPQHGQYLHPTQLRTSTPQSSSLPHSSGPSPHRRTAARQIHLAAERDWHGPRKYIYRRVVRVDLLPCILKMTAHRQTCVDKLTVSHVWLIVDFVVVHQQLPVATIRPF